MRKPIFIRGMIIEFNKSRYAIDDIKYVGYLHGKFVVITQLMGSHVLYTLVFDTNGEHLLDMRSHLLYPKQRQTGKFAGNLRRIQNWTLLKLGYVLMNSGGVAVRNVDGKQKVCSPHRTTKQYSLDDPSWFVFGKWVSSTKHNNAVQKIKKIELCTTNLELCEVHNSK